MSLTLGQLAGGSPMLGGVRKKILLVDDQESVRRLVAATLGGEQFDLFYAADGEQALRAAEEHNPDLILLDIWMPKIDGYQVIRTLRNNSATAGIGVIILSGMNREEDRERGFLTGADEYIVKPFSPIALLQAIRRVLRGHSSDSAALDNMSQAVVSTSTNPGLVAAADILSSSVQNVATVNQRALQDKVQELEVSQKQLLIYAEELNGAYRELQSTYFSTLQALAAAIDARDPYTYGHSQRVALYAVEIGRVMGLSSDQLELVRRAGLLHDIGKIGVPDAALRKPGKLNDIEWEQIKRHPDTGYQMVSGLKFLIEAAPLIRCHHERWDGRGYPQGLVGEDIPLGARILTVADSFDAMTSTRPYRPALSPAQAREETERCRHTQFDIHVVDAFQSGFGMLEALVNREITQ